MSPGLPTPRFVEKSHKMGINYRRVDISTDPEAREYVMALGYLFS